MSKSQVNRLSPSAATLAAAASALQEGQLVVVPTETVYGVAALADSLAAVDKLLAAKERPPQKPLPVMAPNAEVGLSAFADGDAKRRAAHLAERFWPGPLTIVAPIAAAAPVVSRALAGGTSVGVRVPSHPVTQGLLKALGRLVVCPSANRSDQPPATKAAAIDAGFLPHVAMVLEEDARAEGVPSTVVDVSDGMVVLREGPLSRAQLEEALSTLVL